MSSVYFTPEIDLFRKQTRQYLRERIEPHLEKWESERRLPRQAWKLLGEEGLLGLHYPTEYGGRELGFFYSVVYLEELGRLGYGGFRGAMSVHSYMATTYLGLAGNDDQKLRYLKPAINGDKIAALAITEAHAGSDVSSIRCAATPEGDHYLVNGGKAFVTNGLNADFIITAVKVDDGDAPGSGAANIALFVIDADAPGVTKTPMEKLGWHCSDTACVQFEDVRVSGGQVLGERNSGFFHMMKAFQLERLAASLLALGGIDYTLELAKAYVSDRKVFGKAIASYQAIRHRLADLVSHAEAARQLAYHTSWLYDNGKLPVLHCAMSKLRATELANEIASQCLQFFGGRGYLAESPISRVFRDTCLGTIAGGTSEIMREIIAEYEL